MESVSGFREYWAMLVNGLRLAWRRRPHMHGHVDASHLEGVDAVNAKQELSIGQSDLFAAAYFNDLTMLNVYVEGLGDDMTRLAECSEVGNTALHLALQRDNEDVALHLMKLHPPLINITYEGILYQGQHALHIAIINQNLHMVKELVSRGADINSPRAIGTFFHASLSSQSHFYYGEHPIAFAACTGQVDIVEYLFEKGADLYVCDGKKNNVLHLLVLANTPEISPKMYDLIESLADVQAYRHSGKFLEDCENGDGLTPLKLAAFEGKLEMFEHLLNKQKTSNWTYGPVTSAIFNLSQLDSHGEQNSALDLIVRSTSPKAYELLRVPPLPQLLRQKWTQFGFFYFTLWTLIYILYMSIVTIVIDYRPVRYSPCAASSVVYKTSSPEVNGTGLCFPRVKRYTFNDAYESSEDYVRLAGEAIIIMGALASLSLEAPDLIRRGFRSYFTSVGSGVFHAISWFYGFLILSAFIMRLTESDHEEIPQSLALVLGWTYVLYFARGFERLGPYIVMIKKMLTGDVLRFLMLYFVLDLGFSQGLHNLVADTDPSPPFNFLTFARSHFFLFRLAVGIADFNQADTNVRNETLVIILVLVYLLLMLITLVNLLIASMAATHESIRDERVGIWQKQLASIILLIERRLPGSLAIRSGFPGKAIGINNDNWYIRVQELGDLKKISHSSGAPKRAQKMMRVSRLRPRIDANVKNSKRHFGAALSIRSDSLPPAVVRHSLSDSPPSPASPVTNGQQRLLGGDMGVDTLDLDLDMDCSPCLSTAPMSDEPSTALLKRDLTHCYSAHTTRGIHRSPVPTLRALRSSGAMQSPLCSVFVQDSARLPLDATHSSCNGDIPLSKVIHKTP